MKYFIAILAIVCSSALFAQNVDTVQVATSAQCDMCIGRITKALRSVKGVKKIDHQDTNFSVFNIIYSPKKTTAALIEDAIIAVGYDANEKSAKNEAYIALPDCCKKPE